MHRLFKLTSEVSIKPNTRIYTSNIVLDVKFESPDGSKDGNKDFWVLGTPFMLEYYSIFKPAEEFIGLVPSNPDIAEYDISMVMDIVLYVLFWVVLTSGCCCGCFCCCFHPCRKALRRRKALSSVRGSLNYNQLDQHLDADEVHARVNKI